MIVGASLAGLSAAETLRAEGFRGSLTIIGDEPYLPYDRHPLSKAVLTGWIPAEHTQLPRRETLADVEWRLGVAATGLDPWHKQVRLADGQTVAYDRLLIATGTRARPWFNEAEEQLDGVFTLRGRDDAKLLQQRLAAKPRRVLVIGGGFTGSEIASDCRAQLSDGSTLDTEVAVVALGAIRNTEWLRDSGLAVGAFGVGCDAGCRAFDINAIVTDDIFVAGDVARFPHPLYGYQFLSLEHWGNAVEQAQVAAHNMVCAPAARRPHVAVPAFWSSQFGVNIKSVGVPSAAEEVVITQGSLDDASCVAAYGKAGQLVAAVTFNHTRWIEFYQRLIEQAAPFPPSFSVADQPTLGSPVPAAFPDPRVPIHEATVVLTGYDPSEQLVQWIPRHRAT